MPDDDFDDQLLDEASALPEDIDEEDLDLEDEELSEEDLDEDADLDVGEGDDAEVDEVDEADDALLSVDEEEDYEDEEEDDGDDVEASLDVILKSRLVVADEDEEEEETDEEAEGDERGEPATRVLPKQPGEFVCQSCFLVKHRSQLADDERQICRDCI